jgi:DNA mismatch repair protein MutS2
VRGELVAVSGATATVRSGTMTVRVPVSALRHGGEAPKVKPWASEPQGERASREGSSSREVTPEIHLLGQRADEARDAVEQYLDHAFMAGLPTVRLVHGKGTGTLRKVIRELLAAHPLVESFRDGDPSEGGAGATVAALKVG